MGEHAWFDTGFEPSLGEERDAERVEKQCEELLKSGMLSQTFVKMVSGIMQYARRHGRVTEKQKVAVGNVAIRVVEDFASRLGVEFERYDPGHQDGDYWDAITGL